MMKRLLTSWKNPAKFKPTSLTWASNMAKSESMLNNPSLGMCQFWWVDWSHLNHTCWTMTIAHSKCQMVICFVIIEWNVITIFFLGQVKQWVNNTLPFEPCHNKIALVEKENATDYVAMQYLIDNNWNLEVSKCLDPEKAQKTWELKRKMDDGQVRNLPGIRRVYQDKYSKIPKIQT